MSPFYGWGAPDPSPVLLPCALCVSVLRKGEGRVEENAFKCATVLMLFIVPLMASHSIRAYLIKAGWCQPLSLGS